MRSAPLVVALAFIALPLHATNVTLQRGDDSIAGEVCRFRAGDPDNPFKRWLAHSDVVCAPSGADVAFPQGLWNVFGRAAGFVSSNRILVSGDKPPDSIALNLVPSATVAVQVAPARRAVVYIPRLAIAYPITDRVSIPAGEEGWIIVTDRGTPVSMTPLPAIDAGGERSIDARIDGPAAILGWVEVPERVRDVVASGLGTSPAIRVSSVTAVASPLPPLESLHGAFYRVRGLAAGNTELAIGGRGFLTHRRSVQVDALMTNVADPLLVQPASTLIINWSLADDVIALDSALGACGPAKDPSRFLVAISACAPPDRPGESPDATSCSLIREEPIDVQMKYGSVTLDDIAPAWYAAELRLGKLPPVRSAVLTAPMQQRVMRLSADYAELYGSVTLGGEPLEEDVEIRFPGGYGFASKSDTEYRAAFLQQIFRNDIQISVNACDGTPRAVVVHDQWLRRSTRLDIDIPANELKIRVTDTFTREALDGATVRYRVMSKAMPRREIMARTFTTSLDSRGDAILTIQHVPERELRIQVTHAGYQKQDLEPFSITKSESKVIDVQLVPLRGSQGRIVSPVPFDGGVVMWFTPAGHESERADLAPDGTFVYANSHGPDETMVVVSSSHPLWVYRAPALERRQTISVRFPEVAARYVDVTVEGADARDVRHIGAVIGGIRVPQPALQLHQSLRQLAAAVRGPGPLRLRDLADTGTLDVILGPLVGEVAARATGMDFFALPPFTESPKQRVPAGASAVTFAIGSH